MVKTIERPSAIVKISETPRTGLKNWLIYADSGVGKTVLAGTAPNALFLTVEAAGTESAREFGTTADEWVCNSWAEFEEARKWLSEGGAKAYEWVLCDSLSGVEDLLWLHYLGDQATRFERRNEDQAELQDYNVVGNKIKRFVDQMNRLPVNMLYTALPMQVESVDPLTDEDVSMLMPSIGSPKNGKLSQKVSATMTLTGYLAVRTPKKSKDASDTDAAALEPYRALMIGGNRRFLAKSRHHSLGRIVNRPNIEEMVATIASAK